MVASPPTSTLPPALHDASYLSRKNSKPGDPRNEGHQSESDTFLKGKALRIMHNLKNINVRSQKESLSGKKSELLKANPDHRENSFSTCSHDDDANIQILAADPGQNYTCSGV